jgi:hypothetical protein
LMADSEQIRAVRDRARELRNEVEDLAADRPSQFDEPSLKIKAAAHLVGMVVQDLSTVGNLVRIEELEGQDAADRGDGP